MTGNTIGHYQIIEKLGAGGMGEVYKARDTHLNRLVAIKILARDKVANLDRKRRFIQEAQSASALNHPNIVTIHDVQELNGLDFLVMEYISGKTLDELIPGQGMRLNEALKLAIPIADGLAKAHGAGIIHRDIKPANIMVADDGRVKILDFGLAKLTDNGALSEAEATRTVRAQTEEGTVVGTISYMSPEQAEGKKLDERSDIFSFGSLLYEMLSGRKAFHGDSRVSTISAILRDEPKSVDQLPPEVERILRRCLRKDPARRFHSMVDVKVELEEVREESDSGKLSAPVAAAAKRSWIPAAVVGAVAVVALAGAGWYWRQPGSEPAVRLRPLTADSGSAKNPSISADGRMVAYASDRAGEGSLDIWVQALTDGARPVRVTKDPADEEHPVFSPDGGQIVYRSSRGDGGIYIVPALGGEERLLVRGGFFPRFSPDGKWVAYCTGDSVLTDSKVFIVPSAGGVHKQVGADQAYAAFPVWSPDGSRILFLGMTGVGASGSAEYWLAPVDGGASRKTTIAAALRRGQEQQFLAPLSDWQAETLLFIAGSNVWAIDFAADSLDARNLRKIASGTATLSGVRGTTRRFVFSSGTVVDHLWTLPLDLNSGKALGPPRRASHSGGSQAYPAVSVDGNVLAYLQMNPTGDELRVREVDSEKESVLATSLARPKVSPDGKKVAYSLLGPTDRAIHLADAAGGQAQKLLAGNDLGGLYSWTPDGRFLVFYRNAPIRFLLYDLSTGKEQEMISHPKSEVHGAEPSPDLQWVAFHLRGNVKRPVVIAPLRDGKAAGQAEWITIADFGGNNARPWWSPDGKLLYFLSSKDGFACIWARRLNSVTKQPAADAFAVHHFHDAGIGIRLGGTALFGPAIGKNLITFSLRESTSNVWLGEREP